MKQTNHRPQGVKLVVFDWAGTTVDFGCFAPVAAFIKAFATFDIDLTTKHARGPMGLHKRDHVRAMLQMPDVADQWLNTHDRNWNEEDVERLYETVTPLQTESAREFDQLIPGVLECMVELRTRNIKIGTSTGYPRVVAEPVFESAARQGYCPDFNVCADDVPQGRPAPWMIFRNMEQTGVYPPSAVVKVGDTIPDIEEGLSAGTWSIGVSQSGSEVGWSEAEFGEKSPEEQAIATEAAKCKLAAAGAHAVMETLVDLPSLIDDINARLSNNRCPDVID